MSEQNHKAAVYGKGQNSNMAILVACLVFVGAMLGASYAAVPLYQIFCQVTGYGGTTQRADQASSIILDRSMRVEFAANTAADIPWDFKPLQRGVDLRIGETVEVKFRITSRSPVASSGQAVFNVTPMQAGAYFNKVECFCFTDITLKPGESKDMSVVFFIDPEIIKEVETRSINTITLSYTFYAQDGEKPVAVLENEPKRQADTL